MQLREILETKKKEYLSKILRKKPKRFLSIDFGFAFNNSGSTTLTSISCSKTSEEIMDGKFHNIGITYQNKVFKMSFDGEFCSRYKLNG